MVIDKSRLPSRIKWILIYLAASSAVLVGLNEGEIRNGIIASLLIVLIGSRINMLKSSIVIESYSIKFSKDIFGETKSELFSEEILSIERVVERSVYTLADAGPREIDETFLVFHLKDGTIQKTKDIYLPKKLLELRKFAIRNKIKESGFEDIIEEG